LPVHGVSRNLAHGGSVGAVDCINPRLTRGSGWRVPHRAVVRAVRSFGADLELARASWPTDAMWRLTGMIAAVAVAGCAGSAAVDEMGKNVTWFCEAGILAFPLPIIPAPYCDAGYYCPYIQPGNNLTYPQICPPTIPCQLQRLGSQYCDAQGVFEPILCPPGMYCPNFTTQYICPAGHYCMRGSSQPSACPALARCPVGSANKKDFTGLAITFIVDGILVIAFLYLRFIYEPALHRSRAQARRRNKAGSIAGTGLGDTGFYDAPGDEEAAAYAAVGATPLPAAVITATVTTPTRANGFHGSGAAPLGGTPRGSAAEITSNAKEALEAGFRRCNANLRLDLRFDDLSYTLAPPVSKTILSGVSGYIKPGR